MGRQQAQVPGGQFQAVVARQGPQQGHGDRGQGFGQQGVVTLAAHAVQHHTGQLQPALVIAEAAHQRRHGARLPARFHHQHHRQLEQLGHMGGAALAAGPAAIEQAHHPFHQGEVGSAAVLLKAALHPGLAAEQRIEIAAGSAAGGAQQLGVEVVGPHLEGLNAVASAPGEGRERQAH